MKGFNASLWQPVRKWQGPGCALVAATQEPLKVIESLPVVSVVTLSPTRHVWDFGKNFAGFPRIFVKGAKGAVVKLVCGELLDSQGVPSQATSGSPHWFSYTLSGTGSVEQWQPRFSFYGFRWVLSEVSTSPDNSFVMGDMDPTGAIYWLNDTENTKHHVSVCEPCVGLDVCSLFKKVNQSYLDSFRLAADYKCSSDANASVLDMNVSLIYLCAVLLVLKGLVVFSSARRIGFFNSSFPLYNRIHSIILASAEANFYSVWADCPHREKLGWLEVSLKRLSFLIASLRFLI